MSTYTPIASQTLASTAASVTFSSIPQGYTDLVLVVAGNNSSSTYSPYIQFNGDTSTNYSITHLYGNGSTAASARASSTATAYFGSLGATQGNAIVQIQNYSNATTYKTALIRINDAGFRVYGSVMLWRSTAAITSVTVFNESPGTFASGTTFSIYGIQVGDKAQKAQGGNIVTSDGTYVYHTFTSSGSFIPSQALTADYLVVAGGGGSGSGYVGGAGAAGGLRSTVTATGGGGSLESALSLSAGKSYSVIVGAGGSGGVSANGTKGSDSVFATITSSGGGAGKEFSSTATSNQNGGSGAGGINSAGSGLYIDGGTGTANQGRNGGRGFRTGSGYNAGGGGGGANTAGSDGAGTGASPAGGNGGTPVAVSITGSSVSYAGGGGGGAEGGTAGTATGGGGNGSVSAAGTAGTINTGGGAGGGFNTNGVAGGSGIVIIRYAL
jgi:hypothetical protein